MSRTKTFNETLVLQKAMELFWKQGYTATSPADIVSALGISRSSLYGTYGDKRNLFIRSLQHYITTLSAGLIEIFRSSDDAISTLQEVFNNITCSKGNDMNRYGCFVVNTAIEFGNNELDINKILKDNDQNIIQVLSDLLERCQQNGKVVNMIPSSQLARYIYNNIAGLRVHIRMGKSSDELKYTSSIILETLKQKMKYEQNN